jgi:hypothetical protein
LFVQAYHGVQVVVGFCQSKVVCGECVHANNQISHDGLREVPVGWDPLLFPHIRVIHKVRQTQHQNPEYTRVRFLKTYKKVH